MTIGAARFTVATAASAPVSPTGLPPARRTAATSRVLIAPASTDTTTSSVGASVTRKPSTCCFGMPAVAERGVDLLAAAVHDDERRVLRQRGDRLGDALEILRLLEQLAAELQDEGRLLRVRARVDARSASQQARPLVEAEHDVQVLHRRSRRALHQVVDDGHQHDAAALCVHLPADVAEVGVRDVLDLRQRAPVSRTNGASA